jgi:hypothetical protein
MGWAANFYQQQEDVTQRHRKYRYYDIDKICLKKSSIGEWFMRSFKTVAAVAAMLAAMAWSSANAGVIEPITVSNVSVSNAGEYSVPLSINGSPESLYYVGPITFTVNGQNWTTFCDDISNVVYIGSSDQYYLLDASGANAYLSNPMSTTQTTMDQEIAGLAYDYHLNASPVNALFGAEIQIAIWQVLYGSNYVVLNNAVEQGAITTLINNSLSYYALMAPASYAYYELDSPVTSGQCAGTTASNINYLSACQVQGQIFVADPTTIPEPESFGLLFAGLAGFGFMNWRRTNKPVA